MCGGEAGLMDAAKAKKYIMETMWAPPMNDLLHDPPTADEEALWMEETAAMKPTPPPKSQTKQKQIWPFDRWLSKHRDLKREHMFEANDPKCKGRFGCVH